MAPTRVSQNQNKAPSVAIVKKGITTRNQKALANCANVKAVVAAKDPRLKRKADASPLKDKTTKRSALGNITNVNIFLVLCFKHPLKLFNFDYVLI